MLLVYKRVTRDTFARSGYLRIPGSNRRSTIYLDIMGAEIEVYKRRE